MYITASTEYFLCSPPQPNIAPPVARRSCWGAAADHQAELLTSVVSAGKLLAHALLLVGSTFHGRQRHARRELR
ncbi:MAG: hypothetical protein U0Z44_07500 [Kouleothrix sp.]